jgi:hypothetical protein
MSARTDIAAILAKLGSYTGAAKVVACGVTSGGVVVPIRVDANGQVVTVAGS